MNLYNLHTDPRSLLLFKEADEYILGVFWDTYVNIPEELKKRERAISKDAYCAYYYAKDILRGPFPKGEEAISKDAQCAYWYAETILECPFAFGEAAIAKDAKYARWYAKDVLKADFYYDGRLIAKFES